MMENLSVDLSRLKSEVTIKIIVIARSVNSNVYITIEDCPVRITSKEEKA
jgi:hypothetical protein